MLRFVLSFRQPPLPPLLPSSFQSRMMKVVWWGMPGILDVIISHIFQPS
jgi:hypothetical protein